MQVHVQEKQNEHKVTNNCKLYLRSTQHSADNWPEEAQLRMITLWHQCPRGGMSWIGRCGVCTWWQGGLTWVWRRIGLARPFLWKGGALIGGPFGRPWFFGWHRPRWICCCLWTCCCGDIWMHFWWHTDSRCTGEVCNGSVLDGRLMRRSMVAYAQVTDAPVQFRCFRHRPVSCGSSADRRRTPRKTYCLQILLVLRV